MAEFLMPSLGSDMETGTLIEWQKEPGEIVSRGDIIAVVETQKGAIEIEVFDNGVLESQLVEIGRPVPVGTPLAFIRTPDSASSSVPATQVAQTSSQNETDDARSDMVSDPSNQVRFEALEHHRQRISPAARKLAAELGINTALLSGSGPQGAIVLEDISSNLSPYVPAVASDSSQDPQVAKARQAETPADSSSALAEMRRAIATAMARSKREIPHYYLAHTIDVSMAEHWLADTNSDRDPSRRILMGALLLKAVALAAKKYPEFNGYFKEGKFQPSANVHAGMAVNLRGGGLVAPAIHDTHELDVDKVMIRMRDLIERVRQGRFRASELADPTITVSSLGERGVLSLYGVIYPPQVAIIGFGSPAMRPWVAEGNVVQARMLIEVTLAADHRVSDGHRGALFLRYIQKTLEKPGEL